MSCTNYCRQNLRTEQAKRLYEYGCVTEMDIVRLVYRPVEPQGASKTYDFSRSSMEKRWQQGTSDAGTLLHASPWFAPAPKELGVRVFDVLGDGSHRRIERAPTSKNLVKKRRTEQKILAAPE